MKCTHCGKKFESVAVRDVTALSPLFKSTIKAVAYICPHTDCEAVFGVESHPLERDAQMSTIKTQAAKISADIEIIQRKLTRPSQVS